MRQEELNALFNEYATKVIEIFPTLNVSNQGGFSINDDYEKGEIEFSVTQNSLKNTVYTNDITNEFIHYTSIENLFNIMKSDSIRLNNINLLNDPQEFNFLIKKYEIDFNPNQISLFKRSLHIFSFSRYANIDDENFDMWRLYGRDGNGVGVVFELENKNDNWYNYLFGKIQYEEEKEHEDKIRALLELTKTYTVKGLNTERMPIIFGKLLLFHKNKIWANENEYRLSSFFEYDEFDFTPKYNFNSHWDDSSFNLFPTKSGGLGSNISLELNHKIISKANRLNDVDKEKAKTTFPRLKIKSIILGYRFSNELIYTTQSLIHSYNRKKGTEIISRNSKFTNLFN